MELKLFDIVDLLGTKEKCVEFCRLIYDKVYCGVCGSDV